VCTVNGTAQSRNVATGHTGPADPVAFSLDGMALPSG
jgi:hypothetical protein